MKKITAIEFNEMLKNDRTVVLCDKIGDPFYVCKKDDIILGTDVKSFIDWRQCIGKSFSSNLVIASLNEVMSSKLTSFRDGADLFCLSFEEQQKTDALKIKTKADYHRVKRGITREMNGNFDLITQVEGFSHCSIKHKNVPLHEIDSCKVTEVVPSEICVQKGEVYSFNNKVYFTITHQGVDFRNIVKTYSFRESTHMHLFEKLKYNECITKIHNIKELNKINKNISLYSGMEYKLSKDGLYSRTVEYETHEFMKEVRYDDDNFYYVKNTKNDNIVGKSEWHKVNDIKDKEVPFSAIEIDFFLKSSEEEAHAFLNDLIEREKKEAVQSIKDKVAALYSLSKEELLKIEEN